MDASDTSELAAVVARLDELSRECARLSQDNSELRAQMSWLTPSAGAAGDGRVRAARAGRREEGARNAGRTVSRRMMGKTIGAAAAGMVGAVALSDAIAGPAAASNGNPILAGDNTTASSATQVVYNGSSNPGVAFLVNDTSGLGPSESAHSSALGGWAGNRCTHGVYGYTEVAGGDGVIGVAGSSIDGNGLHGVAFGDGPVGVLGENNQGTGIAGTSGSTFATATAIIGTITSTNPGGFSAGVRGVNNGTSILGNGVYGSHAGQGNGVYGTALGGFGVLGDGGDGGTGVYGSGGDVGVSGAGGNYGVQGRSDRIGVSALGGSGVGGAGVAAIGTTGVYGSGLGNGSRGGVFYGAAAQVQLTPGTLSTHPKSGKRGDLYADKTGRLWFCKSGGKTATWHQIA